MVGGRNVADFVKWCELSMYVFVLQIKTIKVLQKAKIGEKTGIYAVFCCILPWFPWIWVFQVLQTKRILSAKARPLRSSTRGARSQFLLPICCFGNKSTPKAPISMCGQQAQIPKFRKICKIFEMSIFEKIESCLRGRQTVLIVRTYIIFMQIDDLHLFEFWKLQRGSSEISGGF